MELCYPFHEISPSTSQAETRDRIGNRGFVLGVNGWGPIG